MTIRNLIENLYTIPHEIDENSGPDGECELVYPSFAYTRLTAVYNRDDMDAKNPRLRIYGELVENTRISDDDDSVYHASPDEILEMIRDDLPKGMEERMRLYGYITRYKLSAENARIWRANPWEPDNRSQWIRINPLNTRIMDIVDEYNTSIDEGVQATMSRILSSPVIGIMPYDKDTLEIVITDIPNRNYIDKYEGWMKSMMEFAYAHKVTDEDEEEDEA